MGSHPTLDHAEPAAEALELEPDHWSHGHAVAHLAIGHPQVWAWPDDNPDLAHRPAERAADEAFDRLNPDYGVPADRADRHGHRDVQQREAALALGIRVAVHDSRQNDPDPVIWQPGQDYRAANAIQAARTQPARARHGPERLGHER